MREQDLEEVLAIENASFPTPWTKAMFLSDVDAKVNPFAQSIVARFPGKSKIIGYACFWLVLEEIHLMNLAVHPDHRQQGIGEKLTRWILGVGQEKKVRMAMLEVRESNLAARNLYEKLGFKTVAVRPGYYRVPAGPSGRDTGPSGSYSEDALVMRLEPLSIPSSSAPD